MKKPQEAAQLSLQIRDQLEALKEEEYKKFSAALIPGIDRGKMLGVRIPALRKLAVQILKEDPEAIRLYLETLDQDSLYEEKLLGGILIGKAAMTDEERMRRYQSFVPVIDNWAVCDITCSRLVATKGNPIPWMDFFLSYVGRTAEYEIRFGVVMLLANFIDAEHIDQVLLALSKVNHPAYYVIMAVGWTLSDCYIGFPQKTEALLAQRTLSKEVQNKTIQKIRESNRVSKQDKEHMKGYKIV